MQIYNTDCDNLPQLRGKLSPSTLTFPYKVVINPHSVTIEGNVILLNCSQEFTRNFGVSKPSWILSAKNTKILKQNYHQILTRMLSILITDRSGYPAVSSVQRTFVLWRWSRKTAEITKSLGARQSSLRLLARTRLADSTVSLSQF